MTVAQLSSLVAGVVDGDPDAVITGVAGIDSAREGDLTFLANPRYLPLFRKTSATAVIVPADFSEQSGVTVIRVADASLAFAQAVQALAPQAVRHPQGIHERAVIDPAAVLEADVAVGAGAVIEAGARIGAGTVVYPGVYIGRDVQVGVGTIIYANVTVYERCIIGNGVIIHSGAVIGSDGFGYATVKGIHYKIPQTGIVVLEDDVEIGANVTVDRARFDRTVIGRGTKIDNLVQIAHNVSIGEHCIFVSQSGVAGSATLGSHVTVAGQAGVAGHITLGDGAVVGGQSGVIKSFPAGSVVWGTPAQEMRATKKILAYTQRLPELVARIKQLEAAVERLTATNTTAAGPNDNEG